MRAAVEFIRAERAAADRPEEFDLGINGAPIRLGPARDGDPDWVLTGSADEVAAGLRRYCEVGANQLQLRFLADSAAEYADQLERFGDDVWPSVVS